jgi:hypothetical protein
MKKFSSIGAMLVAVFLLVSCSSNDKSGLTAIPKNAGMVLVFNGKSLSEKSGVKDFTQTKAYKKMLEEMSPEDMQHLNRFNYILKDVNETGIGINDEFMMFAAMQDQNLLVGINFKVKDRAKLETLMKTIVDDPETEVVIAEEAGISTMLLPDNEGIFCWDDNQLLLMGGEDLETTDLGAMARNLLQQGASSSIQANPHFENFYKNKKDISFWMDYSLIEQNMPPAQQMMMAAQMPFTMKGMYVSAFAEFKNGAVVISYESELNNQMKKLMEEYPIIKDEFDMDALKVIPENSLANMELAFNFYEYYQLLMSLYKDKQINFDQYTGQFEQQLGMTIEEFLKGFSGEMAISVHGLQMTEKTRKDFQFIDGELIEQETTALEPEVLFSTVIRFSEDKVWDLIDTKISEMGLTKENGIYTIPNTEIYFVYDAKNLLVSNDMELIGTVAENGEIDPNLAHSEVADHLKKFPTYMEVDLDTDTYPQDVMDYLREKGGDDFDVLYNALSIYKKLRVIPIDKTSAKAILELKDDSKNSLELILNSFDETIDVVSQR